MELSNENKLSTELEKILKSFPEDDILFYKKLIKQYNSYRISYELNASIKNITEDSSNGKSKWYITRNKSI